MRHRLASLALTLLGTATFVLVPATAQAKPACHGKKATVVRGGGNGSAALLFAVPYGVRARARA
jgi:hypothetical protein